jgi:hypothetical protein
LSTDENKQAKSLIKTNGDRSNSETADDIVNRWHRRGVKGGRKVQDGHDSNVLPYFRTL